MFVHGNTAENAIRKEVEEGEATLGQWVYQSPTYNWSSDKMLSLLSSIRSAYTLRRKEYPLETDHDIRTAILAQVIDADKASINNTTSRAFAKLTSRETSVQEIDLIFSFLTLRVRVDQGELTEDDATRLALEQRSRLEKKNV